MAENPSPGWIKTDFHLHSGEDPCDAIHYTAAELVDRALELGYGALSITLHGAVFDDPALRATVLERGLLLIPGAELRIEGCDCVVLNVSAEEADGVRTFDDLRRLRARRGDSMLTLAPHPFYVLGGSIGRRIHRELDCFDAIELCHFHIPVIDPNRPARRLARKSGKPMLATSDAHRLKGFGHHHTLIQSAPDTLSIFRAIRAGHTRLVSPSPRIADFLEKLHYIFIEHPRHCFLRRREK